MDATFLIFCIKMLYVVFPLSGMLLTGKLYDAFFLHCDPLCTSTIPVKFWFLQYLKKNFLCNPKFWILFM